MGPALDVKAVADDTRQRVRDRLAQIRFALIHFEHVDSPLLFLDQVEYRFDGLAPTARSNRRDGLPDQAAVERRLEARDQNVRPALLQARFGLDRDSLPLGAISQPGKKTVDAPSSAHCGSSCVKTVLPAIYG